ncbi:MAG: hypothetical protein HYU71_06400 [Bacteroidetes bacterium]|nr:hypothetical protein [Bacteroidota bacterium]
MKKVISILVLIGVLTLAFSLGLHAQPVMQRATGSTTVADSRLMVQLNFFLPKYTDTTVANSSKGVDSCGALIFTTDNKIWVRECSPKRWAYVASGNYLNSKLNISDTANMLQTYVRVQRFLDSLVAVQLRVQSKQPIGNYLQAGNNLADVSNVNTARSNLGVFSKADTTAPGGMYPWSNPLGFLTSATGSYQRVSKVDTLFPVRGILDFSAEFNLTDYPTKTTVSIARIASSKITGLANGAYFDTTSLIPRFNQRVLYSDIAGMLAGYLPLSLPSSKAVVLNGNTLDFYGTNGAGQYTSGRVVVYPNFGGVGYQVGGNFYGLAVDTLGIGSYSSHAGKPLNYASNYSANMGDNSLINRLYADGRYISKTGTDTISGVKTFTGYPLTLDGTTLSLKNYTNINIYDGQPINWRRTSDNAYMGYIQDNQVDEWQFDATPGVHMTVRIPDIRLATGTSGKVKIGANSAAAQALDVVGTIRQSSVASSVLKANASGDIVAAVAGTDYQAALGFTPENVANKGAANGYAPIGSDSKIATTYLPAITMNNVFTAASQSAMLALSAVVGDMCVRTDSTITYVLQVAAPSNPAAWVKILSPSAPVSSVNGKTGVVSLLTSDISEGGTSYYWTAARSRAAQSVSAVGLTYNNTTGDISITAGYVIPTTTDISNGNTAYSKRVTAVDLSASTLTITFADASTVTASVPTFNQNTTGNAGTVTNGVYTTTFNGLGDARYLQLTGGTLTGGLAGTTASFSLGNISGGIGSVKNLTVTNTNGAVGDFAGLNFAYYNSTTNFAYIGTVLTSAASNSAADLVFGVKANASATTVTEYMRIAVGGATTWAGSGTFSGTVTSGVAKIGTWSASSSYARFGHSSYDVASNSGFLQRSDGFLYLEGSSLYVSAVAGSSDVIVYADNGGKIGKMVIGSGLSFSGGTLSATGGSAGTVTGSGTVGYIPLWNSASDIGNSQISQSGGLVNINGNIQFVNAYVTSGFQFKWGGTNRGGIYQLSAWTGGAANYSTVIAAESGYGLNLYVDGTATKGFTIATTGAATLTGSGVGITYVNTDATFYHIYKSATSTDRGYIGNGASVFTGGAVTDFGIGVPSGGSVNFAVGGTVYQSIASTGATTFSSSVTASSFSGAGTGLTGTASSLTAGFATKWGNGSYTFNEANAGTISALVVLDGPNAQYRLSASVSQVQTFLGLGSAAYLNSNLSSFTNDAGFITNSTSGLINYYTSTQIQNFFGGSSAITGYNKTNWDAAYGWGNHASAGYLTSSTAASTYVPYSGAIGNVTLGTYTMSASAFYETSDIRLKKLHEVVMSSDGIMAIQYTFKPSGEDKWGYSAQQVRNILPYAVHEDSEGWLKVDYTTVHTYKIMMLEKQVEKQNTTIQQQIKVIASFEERISKLEKLLEK